MESELQKYFGVVRTRDLVRQPHAQAAHIDVEIPRRGGEGAFGYDVTLSGDGLEAAGYIHGGSNYSTDQVDSDHTRSLYRHLLQLGRRWPSHPDLPAAIGLDDIVYVHYVGQLLTETIRSWMLRPLGAFRAHYLPSDRAGLLHSRDVVLSSLLHRATSAGAKPDALLSGLSADFLEQLIRLSGNGGDEDPTNALLARRLEEGILGGEVLVVDSHAKYPHVVYRPAGWEGDLPLSRTSSMVSELASVVLYLRYVLRPADLLIIDEPEAHLHPGSQAVLAREMIRWVRSGLRVVVTTHSDWFLEQVANRVGLAAVPEGRRTGIDEPDVALEADQVGVWLFGVDQERGGSFVDKLGLDSETGLYPADHDAVSEALYNEGARVISRSQGNAGE